jgi:hypothetical protein
MEVPAAGSLPVAERLEIIGLPRLTIEAAGHHDLVLPMSRLCRLG